MISFVSASGETPSLALTEIESYWPCLLEQRLGRREVEDRQRGAAERVDRAEAGDAGDLVGLRRAVAGGADRVADLEACLLAVPASSTISPSPWAHSPCLSFSGENWRPASSMPTPSVSPSRPMISPSLVEQLGRVGVALEVVQAAGGGVDGREGLDLLEQVGGDGGAATGGELDELLPLTTASVPS